MPRSPREIFLFWAPLAATWLMMATEGPFLAAVIARLPDATFNLAAWGVAFAFAILVESPVIMLLSASTALVEDGESYRKLRNFANGLNALATGLLLSVLIPPVYALLVGPLLSLPERVADLTYGALWLFLPWPAAIGYRRFVQGVLIRGGRTRLVAYGTVLRLVGMAGAAVLLAVAIELPGAWVGAAAVSAGVCIEAAAARWMARGTIRELTAGRGAGDEARDGKERSTATEDAAPAVDPQATPGRPSTPRSGPALHGRLDYGTIARFYYPLALTSLLGLTVQPMLTFFMGRAASPVQSLAVFPVVHSLSFIFRALGLSYQDAAIALLGPRHEHVGDLGRFAAGLGLAASAALAAVAFTPLATVWFETVSGLTPELAEFAITPTRVLVPIPALSVLFAFQRAILMQGRRTGPITVATAVEVAVVGALFVLFGWVGGLVGVTAAFLAFLGGRLASTATLLPPCRRVLSREG